MFKVFFVIWFVVAGSEPQQIADVEVESVDACLAQLSHEIQHVAELAPKHKGPWEYQATCAIIMPEERDVSH